MNLIEIEENMSAICSEYNLIEGKGYDFIKKFYKNGDYNDPKSYWSVELKTFYNDDLEVLVMDSGFRLKEYYTDQIKKDNNRCIDIDVKKQKAHYIMILPVTICPPPDMKSWL